MKALIGFTTAATLAVGLVGVASAWADHIPSYLSADAGTCTLDLVLSEGIFGQTDQVLQHARAEVRPGDDAPAVFDSYTCRFDGLTYVGLEGGSDPVPYLPRGALPITKSIACGTGFDPAAGRGGARPRAQFVGGELTIFDGGSALLKCGKPTPTRTPTSTERLLINDTGGVGQAFDGPGPWLLPFLPAGVLAAAFALRLAGRRTSTSM